MTPSSKTWLFGRLPVILFVLTVLVWAFYLAHLAANRPPYPTYPDIGAALALAFYTIGLGLLSFVLSALGLRSPNVPKRWAWSGLLLNSPVVLYLVGFYPATFIYKLVSTP